MDGDELKDRVQTASECYTAAKQFIMIIKAVQAFEGTAAAVPKQCAELLQARGAQQLPKALLEALEEKAKQEALEEKAEKKAKGGKATAASAETDVE